MQSLTISAEDKEQQALVYHVGSVQAQFEEDLRKTRYDLTIAIRERVELIGSRSLTSQALLAADRKIEGLKNGINRLEGYLAELF